MPELVLEMGLLKAASLESVDSAADIISLLRGGVGSGPAATPSRGNAAAPTRGRDSEPAGRPASTARPSERAPAAERPSVSAAAAPADDDGPPEAPHPGGGPARSAVAGTAEIGSGEAWESFLGEVRKHCGFDLYVALSNCDVTRMDGAVLELRPTIGSFKKKLETTEAMSRILEVAVSHYGHPIEIRFTEGAAAPAASGTRAAAPADDASISVRKLEEGRRAKLERDAADDPSVKAALDVLGGRIDRISQVDD